MPPRDSFADRLESLMIRYMRQQLSSAEMIAELVAMAKEVSADARRGERFDPPLNQAELAFYDAVVQQGMARALMGDDTLAKIARALVADIRQNLSVDWLSREPVRAKLRTRIRALDNGVEGAFVAAGTQLAVAYDLSKIFVTARVDEAALGDVRLGRQVDIAVDAHPGITFTGYVWEIQDGAAALFSPSPRDNPTGNFQRSTQVIPVKIAITDLASSPAVA